MREQLLSGQREWGGTEGTDAPSMSGIWNRMLPDGVLCGDKW